MRKVVLIVVVVVLLVVGGLALLLPRQVTLSETVAIGAPSGAVMRSLTQKDRWQQWWPREQEDLVYREQNFAAGPSLNNSLLVDLSAPDTTLPSLLMAIGVSRDSTLVSWEASLRAGFNPLHRVRTWIESRKLKRAMAGALARLEAFAENPQNVYGVPVTEVKVTTPYLIATRATSTGYPTTADVYAQVNKLRKYMLEEGARETAPPMLNVAALDSLHYGFMVALPVDRLLDGRGDIQQKRMVLGNLLQSEVWGGDYTVLQGMYALEVYVRDYGRRSPAIPYASLTTDRTRERDTSKWITHLYYPVF